jgi:small-conductance mechanosensitive channel
VGDFIAVGELKGIVTRVGARSTTVQTFDRVSVIVPNSEFIEKNVINWTHGDPVIRIKLPVGVAYGSDVPLVKRCLLQVAERCEERAEDFPTVVFFNGFGDSSLDFELRVYLGRTADRMPMLDRLKDSRWPQRLLPACQAIRSKGTSCATPPSRPTTRWADTRRCGSESVRMADSALAPAV